MAEKEMNFKSLDELEPVEKLIEEADLGIEDSERIIADSGISEALGGALGAGLGAGVGFLGLFYGGSVVGLSGAGIMSGLAAAGGIVGAGAAAGIAVLAAPVVLLGALGVKFAADKKREELENMKKILYRKALEKQTQITELLMKEVAATKERADYLHAVNIMLKKAIQELREDLA